MKSYHKNTGAIGSQSKKDHIAKSRVTGVTRDDIYRLRKDGKHEDIGQVA